MKYILHALHINGRKLCRLAALKAVHRDATAQSQKGTRNDGIFKSLHTTTEFDG